PGRRPPGPHVRGHGPRSRRRAHPHRLHRRTGHALLRRAQAPRQLGRNPPARGKPGRRPELQPQIAITCRTADGETAMTGWTEEELTTISGSREIGIAPARHDGTFRSYVTIWIVRAGSDLYVRS